MAKSKFYAVRIGRKPGIYVSWAECEEQIKGFRGAEYKSFTDEGDAYGYMEPTKPMFIDTCPQCGIINSLEIVSCTCYLKGVTLAADGFVIQSARNIDTEGEIVRCSECEMEFSLDELTNKE